MKRSRMIWIWIALLMFSAGLSLMSGPAALSFREMIGGLFRRSDCETASLILYSLRLPRVLGAALSGAGLALSGLLLQTVLGNPLAAPNLVGVNAGAGLGVTLCLVFLPGFSFLLPLWSFAGALLTSLMIVTFSRLSGGGKTGVILAGVACSALFQAGISFLTQLDSDALSGYASFTVGGFSGLRMTELPLPTVMILLCVVVSMLFSGRITVLTLGDESASALGIRVGLLRTVCILMASLAAGAAVSFAGLLGFVGLAAPHIAARLTGYSFRSRLVPTLLSGSVMVILADWAGRVLFVPTELPAGVLTALLGAPFFLFLLLQRGRGKSEC